MKEEFVECDTCRAKPGAPVLCAGCIHNRDLIARLLEQRQECRNLFQESRPGGVPDMKRLLAMLKKKA